jgi:predicted alpha/beta hydrolase family esterase
MIQGLKRISKCDNFVCKGEVIFVHGLGGDAFGTWHPRGKQDSQDSWLFWLSQDMPDIQIWSLEYEAEPFAWRGNTMPLVDRATNTLALLDIDDIGERPLVFITHSLGGLLVKQMLRHAIDFGEPRWKAIAEQTKGIVFLSTPHSGSDLANWVNYIGGVLRTTVNVDELEAHHSRLRELNILYRNHEKLSQIPMQVYCEKKKTKGVLVVNETSADPGIKGVTPIPMDEDHLSICRPSSRENQVYRRIKRFIFDNLMCLQPIQSESKDLLTEQLIVDNRRIGNYFGSNTTIYGSVVSNGWKINHK